MPNGQEIADPLSLNLYTYCWNNPIIYVDSTGNKPRVFKQANNMYKASGAEEMTKAFLDAFFTPDAQTMTLEFIDKNGDLQSISYEALSDEAIISMVTGPSGKIAKGAKAAVIAGKEVKAANSAITNLKVNVGKSESNIWKKLGSIIFLVGLNEYSFQLYPKSRRIG